MKRDFPLRQMSESRAGFFALLVCLVVVQIAVCIFFGHFKKRGFFCDEIYSYGLSNSENYTFLNYDSARSQNPSGWVDADYFKDYVTVKKDAHFSLKPAFENQRHDVHPPLYYILLHIVSFLFKGKFSKWIGLGLNYITLLALDCVLYFVFSFVFNDRKKTLLSIMLWSFSAAGLSNISFIRMYLLQTLEIFAYVAVHVQIVKKGAWRLSPKNYAFLFLTVVAGGLTHYYFYPFAFFFSAPICLYLLFSDRIKDFFLYIASLLSATVTNLLIFPETKNHVLHSYQGREVLKNVAGRDTNVFKSYYLKNIDNSLFGGTLKVFFALIVLLLIVLAVRNILAISLKDGRVQLCIKKPSLKKASIKQPFSITITGSRIILFLMLTGFVGFAFFAIQGSKLQSNRYIYPVYPALSMVVVAFLFAFFKTLHFSEKGTAITVFFYTAFLSAYSIYVAKLAYSYSNFDSFAQKAQVCQGYDCLLYYPDNRWLDVYTALPLQFNYDETYFFHENEISSLKNALSLRKSQDPLVVRLPEYLSQEDKMRILSQIEQTLGYTAHVLAYKYYTEVYFLQ